MAGRLHVAFELSLKEWKLAVSSGLDQPVQRRTIMAGDVSQVHQLMVAMKEHFHLRADAPVVTCYEAGRDGFWLHRCLTEAGLENVIVDPASIQVSRRAKRVKTDRIDAASLVRLLMRYHQGERKVWSVVEVPTIEQENSRQLHREELNLQAEQTQLVNELRGHLFAVGGRVADQLIHLDQIRVELLARGPVDLVCEFFKYRIARHVEGGVARMTVGVAAFLSPTVVGGGQVVVAGKTIQLRVFRPNRTLCAPRHSLQVLTQLNRLPGA